MENLNYLKKSDETNFQDKLKSKYFEGTMAENEKIELKKILLENFENLDQEEIKILKEI